MLVEELLRDVVQKQGVASFAHLIETLNARACRSRTTKMWTDNLVKTVIIMLNFSCGGHEGDSSLHLLAAEALLPYFRSAGWHNYARYGAFYNLHSSHERPTSRDDEETTAWCISAPHPGHL